VAAAVNDEARLLVALAALPGFGFMAKWLFDRWVAAADKARAEVASVQAAAQAAAAAQLQKAAADISDMKGELKGIAKDFSLFQGTVSKVESRVEGISRDYSARLHSLEERASKLEAWAEPPFPTPPPKRRR
jgi:DNA repair ATPase RecN